MGEVASSSDPTIYPVREKLGEDILQRWIMELLRPLVERWLRHRGCEDFVGADQFIYYRQHDAHARVAPDVYVLPGVAEDTHVTAWKTWETGIVPSVAIEIVSRRREKDYYEAPDRYAELGVEELIIFDPHYARRPRGEGMRWQTFRKQKRGFRRVDSTDNDRVRSKVLGCWLRSVGVLQRTRLRIGTGPGGDVLFPTGEEAERAEKEAERAEKEAAIAELERLKRELAKRGNR